MLERAALLAGLFLAPALFLWLGHRLRERSTLAWYVFWGGVLGHALGLGVTLLAALAPPVAWYAGGGWREIAVHGSLLAGAAIGALAGAALGRMRTGRG